MYDLTDKASTESWWSQSHASIGEYRSESAVTVQSVHYIGCCLILKIISIPSAINLEFNQTKKFVCYVPKATALHKLTSSGLLIWNTRNWVELCVNSMPLALRAVIMQRNYLEVSSDKLMTVWDLLPSVTDFDCNRIWTVGAIPKQNIKWPATQACTGTMNQVIKQPQLKKKKWKRKSRKYLVAVLTYEVHRTHADLDLPILSLLPN